MVVYSHLGAHYYKQLKELCSKTLLTYVRFQQRFVAHLFLIAVIAAMLVVTSTVDFDKLFEDMVGSSTDFSSTTQEDSLAGNVSKEGIDRD